MRTASPCKGAFAALPGRFNRVLAPRGWIAYERMNADLLRRATELAEAGRLEEAETIDVTFDPGDAWPATAVTSWPAATASSTASLPIRPVAPRIATCMLLLSVSGSELRVPGRSRGVRCQCGVSLVREVKDPIGGALVR